MAAGILYASRGIPVDRGVFVPAFKAGPPSATTPWPVGITAATSAFQISAQNQGASPKPGPRPCSDAPVSNVHMASLDPNTQARPMPEVKT